MSDYTINSEFTFGVNANDEVIGKLGSISRHAESYAKAMESLRTYFNTKTLWTGADAEALRTTVTAKNGPLEKLEACSEELNKLSELSRTLLNVIDTAQNQLKTNVQTAMRVGDDN